MWKFSQDRVEKVQKVLEELGGVCPRCKLRCSGVKNSSLIREAGKKVIENEEPEMKKVKILPCRLCLGLLEERYMISALKSVSF